MSNPLSIQDSQSSHPGTVSQLREQDWLDVDNVTDRHDCVTEGPLIAEKIALDRPRRSLPLSTAVELPIGKEGDNNHSPKAGAQSSDGIRRRGNESSRPQNVDGGTYYTGRQNGGNQNGGNQNGGQQSGGHQNGGSGNAAPNQNGGGPNQNGGPNRDGGPGGDRSSSSSDGSSSSSSSNRNTNGSNDDDLVSDNGTRRGIHPPRPPANDPLGGGRRGPRERGAPDDDDSSSSSDTDRTHGADSPRSVHVPDDDDDEDENSYGPGSSGSSTTVRAPSPESELSDNTVNGPATSPLLANFDFNAEHEPNPPGAYDITIGRWMMPTRHNGNQDRQNIVRPRIDASRRMTYRISPQDEQGRDVRMPRLPGGRRQRQMVSERLLRARLTPAQAQQGYFEYEPRYAAAGAGARRLVEQDIAAQRWAQRQQAQIQDQQRRRAVYPLAVPTFQSRQEFEEAEAAERRRTRRRLRRRAIEGLIRRTARQLDRRWARRRLRYSW